MAIIKCSECGRAISDRAATCVGCGAPLAASEPASAFLREPAYIHSAPLSPAQLRWRLALSTLTLVLGVIAADAAARHAPGSPPVKTLSALLLIVGLCWFIVALVQSVQARRK
jgi:hypothetical protein